MARDLKVERPTKKSEYELRFASKSAQRRWMDLRATIRGPLVDTWDFLTVSPLERTTTNDPLKGELGVITREGIKHERWQNKPTATGDARVWFYVDRQVDYIEQVHTHHPNETK